MLLVAHDLKEFSSLKTGCLKVTTWLRNLCLLQQTDVHYEKF